MNSNLRFIFLIIGVVGILALAWNLLDGGGDEPLEIEPEPISVRTVSETDDASSSWDAPEDRSIDSILSRRRRNRPLPSQTKASVAPQSEPDKKSESEEVNEDEIILSGRVTNKAGRPVVRASVRVYANNKNSRETKTDSGGRYSFAALAGQNYWTKEPDPSNKAFTAEKQAAREYRIYAQHSDYNSASKSNVLIGSINVDLFLPGLGNITGRVVDADSGEAITEFEVVHKPGRQQYTTNWKGSSPKRVSNPEGSFSLGDIKSGDNTVLAQAVGYVQGASTVKLLNAETVDVLLSLKRGAALEGKVVTQWGAPIADATICLGRYQSKEEERSKNTVAKTGASGTFSSSVLPSSTRWIWASHSDYAPGYAGYDKEHPGPVTIVLGSGGTLRGRVTVDGRAVKDARIEAECNSIKMEAQTGQYGAWEITRLIAGTVTVGLQIPETETSPKREFMQVARIIDGQTTEINFDVSSLSAVLEGRVLINGQPPASGRLEVIVESFAGLEGDIADSKIDENGYYRFEALPPGNAILTASVKSAGGKSREKTVTVETMTGRTVVRDIEFTATGSIIATLTGIYEDEDPYMLVLDGEVPFPDDLSELWLDAYLETRSRGEEDGDEDGFFKFENLEVGVYTVWGLAFHDLMGSAGVDGLPEFRVTTEFVEVQADKETRVDLVLE